MMSNNWMLWTMNMFVFLLTDRRPRPVPPSQSERGASGPLGPRAASGTSGCCCSYWGNPERRSDPRWRSSSILRRKLTGGTRRTAVSNSTFHGNILNFNYNCHVYCVYLIQWAEFLHLWIYPVYSYCMLFLCWSLNTVCMFVNRALWSLDFFSSFKLHWILKLTMQSSQ